MMTTPSFETQTPELVESQRGCQVYDSGWRPDAQPQDLAAGVAGSDLKVELAHWASGQSRDIPASAGEEMAAVLQGRFELRCGDETHTLTAGLGLLIPPGHDRRWTALEDGTLYRVTCPAKGADAAP